MRLAVVIAPPNLSAEAAPASATLALVPRLLRGGFRIVEVPLSFEMSAELAGALGELGEQDAVFVYLAGSMRLAEDASLAVRLTAASEVSFRLDAIGQLVQERRPREAFFLVDILHEGQQDAFLSAEYVDAAVRALRVRDNGFGALVGARALPRADEPAGWEFTHLVMDALEDPTVRDERDVARASRVFERVRAIADTRANLPSFTHVRGETDFVLLESPSAPRSERPQSGSPVPPAPSSTRHTSEAPMSAPPTSGPPLEAVLAEGDAARDRGAWEAALEAYKTALIVHGAREGESRADVYARIGAVKRAQDKPREAELNFEKALDAFPAHRVSHEALLALATEAGDFRRVVQCRRQMRVALDDASQLLVIAEILQDKLGDARGALEALEEARTHAGEDVGALTRLRTIYEGMQRWPKVLDVLGDLCRESNDAKERGELRFVQADITLARLRDEARGLSLLHAALEEDPTHDKALHALVAVRTRREEWALLERAYARLIDRHAERGDLERAGDVCKRLGVLRRDQLHDVAGALDAFEGALRCKAGDVESRAALADLLVKRGDADRALVELERMASEAPLRVATFRKLFELHTSRGDNDRAWFAAAALEELGAADMDHQLVVDQFRPEPSSAVRPEAVLDDEAWDTLLRASGADSNVASILRAVGRAAAATQVNALRAQKKLLSLSPQRKQAPTSTVSIVRTFVWASQILSVPLPELYVYDDVPGGLAAVQGAEMSTAIGPTVLRGLPLRELAFVVARHLAYYRPEHYVLIFFPSLSELTTLFLAAVSIAVPKFTATSGAMKLRKELERVLEPSERQALSIAVTRFDAAGGRVDLASWIRGVEQTATRAGLLLAADLAVAVRVMRRESRAIAELSADDKRAELLGFSASPAFATLRKRLGIAERPSTV